MLEFPWPPVPSVRRLARCAAMAAVALLPACAGDQPTSPTSPPGVYALTGHVRLTGYLVNANAQFAGTRVVDDASGVKVELLYGSNVIATTATTNGVYRFGGLAPGGYRTRARVAGAIVAQTNTLTIVGGDLVAGETLQLTSIGDLYPIPNPSADTVRITYRLLDTAFVELRIRNLQGVSVRLLRSSLQLPMVQMQTWDGLDDAFHPVQGTLYWITLESGPDQRAQLLFR